MTIDELRVVITANINDFKDKVKDVNSKMTGIKEQSDKAKQHISQAFNNVDTSNIKTAGIKVKEAFNNVDISAVEKSCKNLDERLGIVTAGALRMQRAVSGTERAEANLDRLKSKLKDIENGRIVPNSVKDLQKELKAAEKELQKIDSEVEQMSRKQGKIKAKPVKSETDVKEFKRLDEAIKKQSTSANELEDRIFSLREEIEKTKANPQMSDEYKRAAQQIEVAEGRLKSMRMQQQKVSLETQSFGGQIAGAMAKIDAAISASGIGFILVVISKIISAVKTVGDYIDGVTSRCVSRLKQVLSLLYKLASAFVRLPVTAASAFGEASKKIVNFSQRVGDILLKVTGLKKLFEGLSSPVKKAGSEMLNYVSISFVLGQIKKGIDAVINAAKSGFENLTGYDKSFALTVAKLKDSITTLQNTITAAFKPVYDVVIPQLTGFINYLQGIADKVAQLIAVIMGNKTYTKANAITKASEDIGKLKSKLAGFDKINTLDRGDGNSDVDYSQMFQLAEVSAEMQNLFNEIKEMWKNADFTELGERISQRLEAALKGIDWNSIHDIAEKAGASVATLSNGIFNNLNLADAIGSTMGDALNVPVKFALNFGENFDFSGFGKFVAEGIKSALKKFNWNELKEAAGVFGKGFAQFFNSIFADTELPSLVGASLANLFNSALEFLYQFINTFNFSRYGTALREGFIAFIKKIDWKKIAGTLKTGVNGIFTALENFIYSDGTQWIELGGYIGSTISDAIEGIDWQGMGETAGAAVNAITDAILGVISSGEPGGIGESIAGAINGSVAAVNWDILGYTISQGVKYAIANIYAFFDEIDVSNVITALSDFFGNIDFEGIALSISQTIQKAVGKASEFIGSLDWQSVGVAIGGTLKNLDLAGIVEGALTLASNIFNAIADAIGGFNASESLKGIGKRLAEAVNNILTNTNWAEMGINISTLANTIINEICSFLNNIDTEGLSKAISDLFGNINIDFDKLIRTLTRFINEIDFTPITSLIVELSLSSLNLEFSKHTTELVTNFKYVASQCVEGFVTGIMPVSLLPRLITWGISIINAIKGVFGIHSPSKEMQTIGNYFVDGFVAGINEKFQIIESACTDIYDLVVDRFSTSWEDAKLTWTGAEEWATERKNSIIAGFEDIKTSLPDIFSTVYEKIKSPFKNMDRDFKTFWQGIPDSLKSVLNECIDKINNFTRNLSQKLKFKVPDDVPGVGGKQFGISIPQIPKLATGGIVTQPTFAMIGEQGKEAVMPLENNTGWIDELARKIAAVSDRGRNDGALYIELSIGGTKFGKVCADSINALQRKKGKVVLEM